VFVTRLELLVMTDIYSLRMFVSGDLEGYVRMYVEGCTQGFILTYFEEI